MTQINPQREKREISVIQAYMHKVQ